MGFPYSVLNDLFSSLLIVLLLLQIFTMDESSRQEETSSPNPGPGVIRTGQHLVRTITTSGHITTMPREEEDSGSTSSFHDNRYAASSVSQGRFVQYAEDANFSQHKFDQWNQTENFHRTEQYYSTLQAQNKSNKVTLRSLLPEIIRMKLKSNSQVGHSKTFQKLKTFT